MLFPKKTTSSESGVKLASIYSNKANAKNPFVTFLDIQEAQQKQVLVDQPLVIWDLKISVNAELTLGGDRVLDLHNLTEGDYGTLVIKQDDVGTRVLTLPTSYSNYVAADGAGILVLSTGANARDIVSFYYDGLDLYWNVSTNYTSS
jgi:hypothetical protein